MQGDSRRNAGAKERRKFLKTPDVPQKASLMIFLEKKAKIYIAKSHMDKNGFLTTMETTIDIVVHVSTYCFITVS